MTWYVCQLEQGEITEAGVQGEKNPTYTENETLLIITEVCMICRLFRGRHCGDLVPTFGIAATSPSRAWMSGGNSQMPRLPGLTSPILHRSNRSMSMHQVICLEHET